MATDYSLLPENNNSRRPFKWWHCLGFLSFPLIIGSFIIIENLYRPSDLGRLPILLNTYEHFDSVFIGTSSLKKGINPKVVNFPSTDCNPNVFNMSLGSLSFVEAMDILQEIEKAPHLRPKFIIVDSMIILRSRANNFHLDNIKSARGQGIYKGSNLQFILLELEWMPIISDEIAFLTSFFYQYALNSLRSGELSHWIKDTYNPTEKTIEARTDNPPFNPKKIVQRTASKIVPEQITGFQIMIDKIKAIGSTPIIISLPFYDRKGDIANAAMNKLIQQHLPDIVFLDYSGKRYPELSSKRVWEDNAHLNKKGSSIFSEHLRADLCKLINRK